MDNPGRTTPTHGMNTWRAGCSESCTSGSEGGPEKPTHRKMDRALRSDPYTYVWTVRKFVYVAFVIDAYARRIVGWRVTDHLRTDLALDALDQVVYDRLEGGRKVGDLVAHSNAGRQYTAMAYTERLIGAGIAPSIGSVGDSFDNTLAETIIGLYKTEVIYQRERWDTLEHVEWETMRWVSWFNHQRLFGPIGFIPPAEHEANYYRHQPTPATPVGVNQ